MRSYRIFAALGASAACLVAGAADVLGHQAWKAQKNAITANN